MKKLGIARWFRGRRAAWARPPQEPVDPPTGTLPFDGLALRIYRWGFWLAPSWLFIDAAKRFRTDNVTPDEKRKRLRRVEKATAGYVFLWIGILFGLWLWSPSDDLLAKALGVVALFRLFEIALTVLGFVLGQREPRIARSLITIGLLAFQVALIFALLDHAWARYDFCAPGVSVTGGCRCSLAASSPGEYLYLSWSYMTTVNNAYTPATGIARFLQVTATTSGILLLGIVAARAIGLIDDTKEKVAGIEGEMRKLKDTIEK